MIHDSHLSIRLESAVLEFRRYISYRGFGFRVESSTDLVNWTADVNMTSGDGYVTASVPADGPARFLRLVPFMITWVPGG